MSIECKSSKIYRYLLEDLNLGSHNISKRSFDRFLYELTSVSELRYLVNLSPGLLFRNHSSILLQRCLGVPIRSSNLEDLKYLMELHKLNQSDLHAIGSQGVISEILNGKRKLNLRQIKILAKLFDINPATFIDEI